jgi:hypothetical protein
MGQGGVGNGQGNARAVSILVISREDGIALISRGEVRTVGSQEDIDALPVESGQQGFWDVLQQGDETTRPRRRGTESESKNME